MASFDALSERWPVRSDLPEAHRRYWEALASPGTWLSGAERVAVAAEVRAARDCALCAARKEVVSASMVDGAHDRADPSAHVLAKLSDPKLSDPELSAPAVDAIHRLVTDQGRLSRAWFDALLAAGLSEEEYVEILGVVVCMCSIDAVHRGLGVELEPLPDPKPGAPTRARPATLARDTGWVPMIPVGGLAESESDLWSGRRSGNVIRAMSLVPDAVRAMKDLSSAHYMAPEEMQDFTRGRTLDRRQIELVAGRVSAIKECFY